MTRTGALCLSIHYSADEDKRDPEWKREASRGWPLHAWLKEMEMDDSIVDGSPVFPEFRPEEHAPREYWDTPIPQCHDETVFYIAGLDPGFTPGFVLLQITGDLQVQVLHEITVRNMSLSRFIPTVLAILQSHYPWAWPLSWWMDPTAANREAVTGMSPVHLLTNQFGIIPHLAPNDWETRRSAVSSLLMDYLDDDRPKFIMCRKNCPVLYDGFLGLYQFKKTNPHVNLGWGDMYIEQRPVKNLASHVQDALQYAVLGYQAMIADRIHAGYAMGVNEVYTPHRVPKEL
jgi:hypothetical protein